MVPPVEGRSTGPDSAPWVHSGYMETDRLLDLDGLLGADPPFLSVRLTTEPAVPNAGPRSHLRWQGLRTSLATDGVPETLLERVDPLVDEAHRWGRVLHVVVSSDGQRFVEHVPDPDDGDVAEGRYEWLPWILPVIASRQREIPHVIVLTDRRGADLIAVRRGGEEILEQVQASSDPITRVAQSSFAGWAEHRYQQRAENSWESNAGEVATEVARISRWAGAEFILVAGDVRAVQFLRAALPDDVDRLVRVVGGERQNEGGSGGVHADVDAFVREQVEAQTAALLARFDEESGQRDLAVEGADQVIGALAAGQVATLLLADDRTDEREAWFGQTPAAIAPSEDAGATVGLGPLRPGPLRDVLVRAALGTGAEVRVLPRGAGPAEDIGALLRWS